MRLLAILQGAGIPLVMGKELDRVLLKFDDDCSMDSNLTAVDYFRLRSHRTLSRQYLEYLERSALSKVELRLLATEPLGAINEEARRNQLLTLLIDVHNSRRLRSSKANNAIHYLPNLKIYIIENGDYQLLEYANELPCLKFDVSRDRSLEMHGTAFGFPKPKEGDTPVNDPASDQQWFLRGPDMGENFGIGAFSAWSHLLKSKFDTVDFSRLRDLSERDTYVAVVDTGCSDSKDIDLTLTDKLCSNGGCIGVDFTGYNDSRESSSLYHGTGVAGIIAAKTNNKLGVASVCPWCKVVCLKTYDAELRMSTHSAVLKAMDFIAEHSIPFSTHSYGSYSNNELERDSFDTLRKLGVLSFVSAGNKTCNIDPDFIGDASCYDEQQRNRQQFYNPAATKSNMKLTVGSISKTGTLSDFSNYGKESVDLFAPGEYIKTLYGPTELSFMHGTSISVPIAAGIAAALYSTHPHLTTENARDILIDSLVKIPSLRDKGSNPGTVNMERAILKAQLDKNMENVR